MTAIAAIKTNDGVLVGTDSAVTRPDKDLLLVSSVSKVFELEDLVVGVSGSIAIGQYLSRTFRVPGRPPNTSLARYMVAHFGPAVEKALRQEGLKGHCSILIATPENGLFISEDGAAVVEPQDPFAAIGTGANFALGALRATRGDPRGRLLRALDAAAHFDPYVRPPFTILKAERKPWLDRIFSAAEDFHPLVDKAAAWAPDPNDRGE